MKIKTKLIAGGSLMAVIPAIIVGLIIGSNATDSAHGALEHQAKNQLIATREATKQRLDDYFVQASAQLVTMSKDKFIQDAAFSFTDTYPSYLEEVDPDSMQAVRDELSQYYEGEFASRYKTLNPQSSLDSQSLLAGISDTAALLQDTYIQKNPHPVGQKNQQASYADGTRYSLMHARYHPTVNDFLQSFGYYDIFIVDAATGEVVYSVFKELDFATSLKTGPYAQSELANVYRRALELSSSDEVVLSDLRAYQPSYDTSAAFMASPIVKDGKTIGVLIYQLSTDRINNLMTHGGQWSNVGLGDSGETYLVGQDFKMRSTKRLLLEDNSGYFALMSGLGVDDALLQQIAAKNSTVGYQEIDSPASQAALAGDDGFVSFEDKSGTSVLSAYTPFDYAGGRWALMSEMSAAEALAPVTQLRRDVFWEILWTGVVMVLIGGLLGLLFANYIVQPINQTVNTLRDIAEGEGDLTQKLDDSRQDELGELARWFNRFLDDLQSMVKSFQSRADDLNHSAVELSEVSQATEKTMADQQLQTTEVASATNQMSATIQEVSQSSQQVANAASDTLSHSQNGMQIMRSSHDSIAELAVEVKNAALVITNLESHAESMRGVIDVIRGVADQTNLLALNAAIEAARAGEQGRGFAVVADEVRTLASRTQASTEDIEEMISVLQKGTREAAEVMNHSNVRAEEGLAASDQADQNFAQIAKGIEDINAMIMQIATATEEQSATAEEINLNVTRINDGTNTTANSAKQSAESSQKIADIAEHLYELTQSYKT